jgi:hypothetical protein
MNSPPPPRMMKSFSVAFDSASKVPTTNGASQKCSLTFSGASNDWMPRAESQSPTFDWLA